ncbi:MAG TPA: hypothetical protein VJ124_16055 [Pyrinomonadaceae bacterium]|nr:hypothetical protein [Pyrinomonadaceae bacterium]
MTADEYVAQVKVDLGEAWLGQIYGRILKMRTRAFHFPSAKPSSKVEIHHTLLGVELKVGNRRLLCPDLATARYLAVFARLGVTDVAVPYDITRVSQLADELESSWHRMLLLGDDYAADASQKFRTRTRGLLIAKLRAEILAAGPGTVRPQFKQSTKQRA